MRSRMLRWGSDISDLDDHRDDHRAAAVGVGYPFADGAAYELLELVHVVDPFPGGAAERLLDQWPHPLEGGSVLGEAAGEDLRSCGHLAGDRVDDDDDRDEALAAEDA